MEIERIDALKEQFSNESIMFCYVGSMSHIIMEQMGGVLKQKMAQEETGLSLSQKVFGTFVEQVQNIMNYSAEKIPDKDNNREVGAGIVLVGKENHAFYIAGGNLILAETKQELSERIDAINKLDKSEMKSFFKQKLSESQNREESGGGVGLIDMARKASAPIEYRIKDIDDEYSFFSLKVII